MPVDPKEYEHASDWLKAAIAWSETPEGLADRVDAFAWAVRPGSVINCPNEVDMFLHGRSALEARKDRLTPEDRTKLAEADRRMMARYDEIRAQLDPKQIADAVAEYGEHWWWTGRIPAHV